jgi:hypothetical protein
LAGTTLLSLLASLFMEQLLFVVGVGGIQVRIFLSDFINNIMKKSSSFFGENLEIFFLL